MEPEHPDLAKASMAQKALKRPASYEDLFFIVVAVAERFVRIVSHTAVLWSHLALGCTTKS